MVILLVLMLMVKNIDRTLVVRAFVVDVTVTGNFGLFMPGVTVVEAVNFHQMEMTGKLAHPQLLHVTVKLDFDLA